MRFVGRGHPVIRATHHKTLEVTPADELTARGTCVVAVSVTVEPPAPMAGPVRIRIAAGDRRFGLDAVANPLWDPTGSAVVRRSARRDPGTFATEATAAAGDLPRELVAALADPDTLIALDVAPRPSDEPIVVLFAADPAAGPSPALRAELERADEVVAEDADARRLVSPRDRGASGPHSEPGAPESRRLLVVATRDLPGGSVTARLAAARIETVGLPARFAVAAAASSRGPLVFGREGDLRRTPAGGRLVVSVDPSGLDGLVRDARTARGPDVEIVVAQEHGRPLRIAADPQFVRSEPVHVCIGPGPGTEDPLDPAVRAAITALLTGGVATKTAAQALAALTGWERRRAYAAVVELRAT